MNAEQAETAVSSSDNRALLLCKTYWNTFGEILPSARHTFFQISLEYNERHACKHVVELSFLGLETLVHPAVPQG